MANTVRIKRRAAGGAAGAPTSLANAELAFNEQDDTLYYGKGTGGAGGSATSVIAIAGPGAFVSLSGSYSNPSWITALAGSKITGNISGNAANVTGTVALANGGTGATDASTARTNLGLAIGSNVQAWDADLDAIAALAGTSGLLKKTAANTWTLDTNVYLTGNQTITVSGDATGSGTTAITLTLKNTGTAGTYAKVTTDAQGRVTSGTTLSATDIPTLTASKISDFDTQVRTSRLDQMAAPTASVSLNSQKITNLLDPVNAQDAATKAYVDNVAQGIDHKASVRAATTANITLSGLQTIDGVTLVTNDRVLVKNQTTTAENGIYVAGTGAWARATDMDVWSEVPSAFTFVEEGTTLADTSWVCSSNAGGTLGSTAITWVQFGSASSYTAGNGLTLSGNIFNIGTASSARIVVNADDIDLATIGTAGTYRSVTVDAYGRVSSGTNPTTLAGYGITDAQGLDATLTALAGLTTAADQMIYSTGADAFSMTALTSFARSLLDDADASTARTTLGLGTIATQAASNVSITGGSITGLTTFDSVTVDCGTF